MKKLRKTILYLADTLKRKDKSAADKSNDKVLESPYQQGDSDSVFGYQWDDSKLSNSYRTIKQLSYQKWR